MIALYRPNPLPKAKALAMSLSFLPSADPEITFEALLDSGLAELKLEQDRLTLVDDADQEEARSIDLREPFLVSLSRAAKGRDLFLQLRQQKEERSWTRIELQAEAGEEVELSTLPAHQLEGARLNQAHLMQLLARLAASKEEGLFSQWHPPLDAIATQEEILDALPESLERHQSQKLALEGPNFTPRAHRILVALSFVAVLAMSLWLLKGVTLLLSIPTALFPAYIFALVFHLNLNTTYLYIRGDSVVVQRKPKEKKSFEISTINEVFVERKAGAYFLKARVSEKKKPIALVHCNKEENAIKGKDFLVRELGLAPKDSASC